MEIEEIKNKEDISQYWPKKCRECGNNVLVFDGKHAEIICGSCGLILQERIIDNSNIRRAFTTDEKNKRLNNGPPTHLSFFNKGLNTSIGQGHKSIKNLPVENRALFTRLIKRDFQEKNSSSESKHLKEAMRILHNISSQLRFTPFFKEFVAHLYRKIRATVSSKGRPIVAVVMSAIYISSKICNFGIQKSDLLEFGGLKAKILYRICALIQEHLKIKFNFEIQSYKNISKYCMNLNLSKNTEKITIEILDLARSRNIGIGSRPVSLSAGAIYLASILNNEKRSQEDISKITNVCTGVIRKHFNRFKTLIPMIKS